MGFRSFVQGSVAFAGALISLSPAAATAVWGEAGRTDGKPIAASVVAWPLGAAKEGPPPAAASLDASGRFALDLAAGVVWDVEVRPEGLVPARTVTPVLGSPVALEPVDFEPTGPARIRVAGSQGAAVAGARVLVVTDGLGGRSAATWSTLAQVAETDAAGEVEVELGSRERTAVVAVAPQGAYAGPYRERVDLAPGSSLQVVDAQGEPVAGAVLRVAGWPPLATTDAQGRAVLPAELVVSDGQGLVVEIGGVPRLATPKRTEKPAEEAAAIVLVLGEPKVIEARLVDARDGHAIAGGLVWSEVGAWARSDAGGAVSLSYDWASGLNVAAEGYLAGAVYGRRGARGEPEVVRLEPALWQVGRALDREGVAVPGASVYFSPSPRRNAFEAPIRWSHSGGSVRTDAAGAFRVPVAADSSGDLSVRAAGFAAWSARIGIGREAPPPLEVILDAGVDLTGRVVAASGEAVRGAAVAIEPSDRLEEAWNPHSVRVESDAEGRFLVAGLGPGDYLVTVEAAAHPPLAVGVVTLAAGTPRVDLGTLVLEAGVPVLGRVVESDGQPRSGAQVFGSRAQATASRPATAVTGPDGAFRLDGFRAGERVVVRVQTESTLTGETHFVAGDPPRDLVLQPIAGLSVVVENPDGTPAIDATVELESKHEGGVGRTQTTGSRVMFDGFSLGAAVLVEARGAAGFAGPVAVEIAGEGRQEVRLRLEPRPALEVWVHDDENLPIAGATARIGGEGPFRQVTDLDGRLRLLVGLGRVEVVVSHPDYEPVTRQLDLPADGARVDVLLRRRDPEEGRLRGRVVDLGGRGVVGALVRARADSGRVLGETASGAEGRFELVVESAREEDGPVRLVARMAGSAPAELGPLDLASLEGAELILELRPGGEIVGRVSGLDAALVASAGVGARREDEGRSRATVSAPVDASGGFSLRGLEAGRWRLWVELPGGLMRAQTVVELSGDGDRREVELRVAESRRVAGTVRKGSEPVGGIQVSLLCSTTWANTQTAGDGRFVFAGAPEEPCQLGVQIAGSPRVDVDESGDVELDVALPATGSLAGAVTDAFGAPIAGAAVEVFQADDEACRIPLRQAASRADGSFVVRDRPPGALRLRASALGYGRAVVEVAAESDGALLALVAGASSPARDSPGCLP